MRCAPNHHDSAACNDRDKPPAPVPVLQGSLAPRRDIHVLIVNRSDESLAEPSQLAGSPEHNGAGPACERGQGDGALQEQVDQLQRQLRRREDYERLLKQAIQELEVAKGAQAEAAQALTAELAAARSSRAEAEAKLQQKIGEANHLDQQHRRVKEQHSKLVSAASSRHPARSLSWRQA